jgi:PleD family two-component response regulator
MWTNLSLVERIRKLNYNLENRFALNQYCTVSVGVVVHLTPWNSLKLCLYRAEVVFYLKKSVKSVMVGRRYISNEL